MLPSEKPQPDGLPPGGAPGNCSRNYVWADLGLTPFGYAPNVGRTAPHSPPAPRPLLQNLSVIVSGAQQELSPVPAVICDLAPLVYATWASKRNQRNLF